ncbi:hypothetical protein BJV85_003676 [Clostridium acetobutylicum]|uniref:Uncharacterized protein n=1 Tax=Clostridium acetobutylicum (strain ATCC 824 / DSM 792 / JCM 1419 / IAM 19013 / LMG 5710 / NBRC 13948 / NRRL B-527 / VKM B-1787 / 2291 / W) TaxID=272562 RepID=Q97M56_CLOAB|nr:MULTISPECIES: hypothetical protein [Clostridium]AAK78324.1 Hypothetical protein CA_C0344 [Clostridium acetobutylicum ATCC 824]ADZ19393.1 Conserved hypothetical protein [Clostridium acetobutylicum EA 2018]AEI31183.1 hypothetical protein SMB_G0352 [Clostridium acetobutylicum DSM 1731]AWV80049.1 hypothetical protein DK921_08075 [Clostridium acetobutylicum]MBC2395870.1 hypothetical protein [Clostridium acetobutylicum]
MKQDEYMKKVNQLGINLERLNIVVGRKTNIPNSIGCYFEDENWILYGVDERQNFSIVENGNEDRIFKFLYMITMGKVAK